MIFGGRSQNFKPNLNFFKVQNLNRIFWFEVYAHSDGHSCLKMLLPNSGHWGLFLFS